MGSPDVPVQPTVAMPSADLITFRFDQTDKNIAALDRKIDSYAGTFVTKEELESIKQQLSNYTWYWRSIFTALLLCIVGIVGALIEKK